ncbi:restriction endonuclease subunit S [Hanamia caeni]|jgi:type I restriction enzyme S subunit|uniref:Restriction endonuclease subunit S n=1 Tax=Hanamia caeni TaxID=2294116 RepID=A0A3M9N9I4_9BACT|nr:restriction endonuclease subunit S [Hanamia caeni]RNI33618.1 restriction endonuclease subunit S [Hanamia caeni]
MSDWEKYKFSEFAEIIKDGFHPSSNGELFYIGLEHIEQQTLRLYSIGKSSEVTSNKFRFKKGDILFGKLRPYFRKVYRPKFSGVCSTDIWVIRARKEFDQSFLFYFLASEEFISLSNQSSNGTRMPRADWNNLKNIQFLLPDFPTQIRIASILSSLDDKIELNRRMNHTLEQMAQALFNHYFVDNIDPDNLPEGWRWGKLNEMYKTTSGGTPSRTKMDYYNDGNIFWVKSKELNNGFILDTEEKITIVALNNSSAKILPKHSVLVAMYGATVGEIATLSMDATCNQAICAILPNDNYPYTFIFQFLKENKQQLINRASGSAQQNISQIVIQNLELVVPSISVVSKFHQEVNSLFLQIENNLKENNSLSQIRDTLLPKLMSGEIDVDKIIDEEELIENELADCKPA